ncbi:MAG: hypothetical protein V3V08_09135 [Nannocystaceae bacterium]
MPPQEDPIHTPLRLGTHELPGLWRYLLPKDLVDLRVPEERIAPCSACPQVEQGVYRADCRCCTYFPPIPNFMLGFALADPATQDGVRGLVTTGYALPSGLYPSPVDFREAARADAENRYGNDPSIACPMFDGQTGRCGVYKYRNSVCATFFCANDHGEPGSIFWDKLQNFMGNIELTLSQWAMEQVGMSSHVMLAALDGISGSIEHASHMKGGWGREARAAIWGEWLGRETEFFEACARVISDRREELYEIACERRVLEPLAYEHALRDWMPADLRAAVPEPSDAHATPTPIGELWYLLRLSARNLWALPFNDGTVELAETVRMSDTPESSIVPLASRVGKHAVRNHPSGAPPDLAIYITPQEATLLRVFREPQVLGEAFFERPEVAALDDARGFLAECMRRKLLVAGA